jgi:hypothetical protein
MRFRFENNFKETIHPQNKIRLSIRHKNGSQ